MRLRLRRLRKHLVVDEFGRRQVETLNYGDIWYFPKGTAHTIQGLEEEN